MNARCYDSDWDYYEQFESKEDDDDFIEPDEPQEDQHSESLWEKRK